MSLDSETISNINSIVISSDDDTNLIIDKAKCLVDELYNFRDTYFENKDINECTANQKVLHVKEKMHETIKSIEGFTWDRKDIAYYHLFIGKALNVVSEHEVKCQENLSKSIKLNPKLSEAWYQLGECHWKKNDIDGAYNCFKSALEYQSDKHILRAMSMVIRQLPSSTGEERKNRFTESINKAKEALKLDMTDGKSWAILGSAYLNSFLAYPFNSKSMSRALAAYQKAIQDPIANTDPDLHYNYGIALQYESSFNECLNQWCLASCLDPTWKFPKESISQAVTFIDKLLLAIHSRGKMKEKRFRQLVTTLKNPKTRDKDFGPYLTAKSNSNVVLKPVIFSDLKEGTNGDTMVLCKVICGVVAGDNLAYTVIIADETGALMPLRVFNLGQGKGPVIGDSVAVPEPYVESIAVQAATITRCRDELIRNEAIFRCDHHLSEDVLSHGISVPLIRVSVPNILVVNGRKINNQWTALPVVQNLYFTENWLSSMN